MSVQIPNLENLEKLKRIELRAISTKWKIPNVRDLKKKELIEAIRKWFEDKSEQYLEDYIKRHQNYDKFEKMSTPDLDNYVKNVLKLKTRVTRRSALLKKIYDNAKNKNTITTTHLRNIAKKLKIKGSTTRIRPHVIELLESKILEDPTLLNSDVVDDELISDLLNTWEVATMVSDTTKQAKIDRLLRFLRKKKGEKTQRQVQYESIATEKLRNKDLKSVLEKRGVTLPEKIPKQKILENVTQEDVFEGLGRQYTIINDDISQDYKKDLDEIFSEKEVLAETIKNDFKDRGQITNVTSLKVNFENPKNRDIADQYFSESYPGRISFESNISEYLDYMKSTMSRRFDAFEGRGSGLIYRGITLITLKNTKYNPSTASSYIPLPANLIKTRALLNIHNDNDNCFKYVVTASEHPMLKNPERPKQYEKFFDEIDWSNLEFPFKLEKNKQNIQKFELANNDLPPLFIHLYTEDSKNPTPSPVYTSIKPIEDPRKVINLLYYANEQGQSHFVLIKHMSRLYSKTTKHDGKCQYVCPKCIHKTNSFDLWKFHDKLCQNTEGIIQMPNKTCEKHEKTGVLKNCRACIEKNIIKFEDYYKQQNHAITIYGDSEAMNIKVNKCNQCGITITESGEKHCDDNGKECKSTTIIETKQQLVSYGLHSVIDDEYKDIFPKLDVKLYKSDNERDNHIDFMKTIKEYVTKVQKIIEERNIPHNNDISEMNQEQCHICKGVLDTEKVIDHDHLTGKIRGLAHKECNFKYTLKGKPIPIIFHNWKKYDCKMLMKAFAKETDVTVKPIAQNGENFKTVNVQWPVVVKKYNFKNKEIEDKTIQVQVQFIDSFAHLPTSLDKLVNNLKSTNEKFKELSKKFPNYDQFNLLLRKGVFPYEWFDSFDKLKETKLPPKQAFYSSLKKGHISDEDYKHAQNVWKVFDMKTFEDYHDLYLKTDILLLADVCEAHKALAMYEYGLNPWFYVTTPSFAWRAMLKKTGIRLEPLLDIDIYNFIMRGKRGGISYCPKKYAKANNPNIKDYDPKQPMTHILYIDANNLYGWAMSQPLPTGGFKWVDESKYDHILNKLEMNEPCKNEGYTFEVDIKLPQSRHFEHSDFPLCPEHMKPPCELHTLNGNSKDCIDCKKKNMKLINHCWTHYNYIIDSAYLKVALQHGLKVMKVHKILEYKQSNWMQSYIDFNTMKRNNAKNNFEKDFFKLMNNSVYGGTLLQAEKFVNFKVVTSKEKYQKIHRYPSKIKNEYFYHKCGFCNKKYNIEEGIQHCECLAGLELVRSKCTITRPIYVGVKILELSKALMGSVWYQMKNYFGSRIQLIMTDTDSFMFQLETNDIKKDFFEKYQNILDLSNSSFQGTPLPEHLDLNRNKKVLGKMKNEVPPYAFSANDDDGNSVFMNIEIDEVVALGSKCYSVKLNYHAFDNVTPFLGNQRNEFENLDLMKAKGVTKASMNNVTHDNYQHVLKTGETHTVNEYTMRSKNQEITIQNFKKDALTSADDKRNFLPDKLNSIPYGYEGPIPKYLDISSKA